MAGHRTDSGAPLDAAVIGVADIEHSTAFYRDQIGLDLLASGTVDDPATLAYWHSAEPMRMALLGYGPDAVGRVMLLQFGSGGGVLIREPGERRATGLANLNFYTDDIHADYDRFRQLGFEFWSEPVQHDFGPRVGTPIEVVFDGPDGVAINLVELITPDDATLIGEMRRFVAEYGRTDRGYTPVVTSAHNVQSIDAAVAFYERVLGMHVAIDEVLESAESNHFLGLESDARTHTVFVQGAHMFGKIALSQPLNYSVDSLVERAVAPNIGYLAQSFRVEDLAAARAACDELGAAIYSDIAIPVSPGRNAARSLIVRNPGSGALQELYEA
jgi:catechol 2,3-dioxygenase-like lactoylglutathione lyase family enzyme